MSAASFSVVRSAVRVLVGQLIVTAALSALGWMVWGAKHALSLLAGGGIAILATASMALIMARQGEGAAASRAAWGFFVGWTIKVMLTITLLVMAFRSRAVAPLPVLIGYAATYGAYWWAVRRQRR